MSWVTKYLKSGASLLLKAVGVEITRRCAKCLVDTAHRKFVCQSGSSYYFCQECGKHN